MGDPISIFQWWDTNNVRSFGFDKLEEFFIGSVIIIFCKVLFCVGVVDCMLAYTFLLLVGSLTSPLEGWYV